MTQAIQHRATRPSLLDIVERASLFALLQQALEHHKPVQELPGGLYDDLGIPPNQRPDFVSRFR